MIIGSGLIATSFKRYADELQGVCIFASGVANSSCTDSKEFLREKILLEDTLAVIGENHQFAYFSTCSVHDPLLSSSAYVKHKLAMESIVLQRKKSHVFRLPQLAGNSKNTATLLNYLSDSIENQSSIKIWSDAERNIIDVEDVASASLHYIKNCQDENISANVCNPHRRRVLDIVKTLEKIKNKTANVEVVEGGSYYDIPLGYTKEIYSEIGLLFPESYLEDVLRKYYSR